MLEFKTHKKQFVLDDYQIAIPGACDKKKKCCKKYKKKGNPCKSCPKF